jgi:hypothetical protein
MNPKVAAADLLRRLNVLAYRLHNEELKVWIENELSGHGDDTDLPDYRRDFEGTVQVDLVPDFGRVESGVPVPKGLIPAGWETKSFPQGVAALEAIIKDARTKHGGLIRYSVPVELYARTKIGPNAVLREMEAIYQPYMLESILDAIKSKAQAFALELEELDPTVGDVPGLSDKVTASRVSQIFHTHIKADQVQMAQGNAGPVDQTINVTKGDIASLMAQLKDLGLAEEDRDSLRTAIEADKAAGVKDEPGEHTNGWIGRTLVKLRSGVGQAVPQVAAGLVVLAVAQFFGLNQLPSAH